MPIEPNAVILETYHIEYTDLVTTWQDLEKKAQSITAIAGIFLAAIVGLFRDGTALALYPRLVLIAAIAFLVASILCAAFSVRIMDYASPPRGLSVWRIATRTSALQDSEAEFVRRVGNSWNSQSSRLDQTNSKKVFWVGLSFKALIIAIVLAAAATSMRLWPQNATPTKRIQIHCAPPSSTGGAHRGKGPSTLPGGQKCELTIV